MKPHLFWARLGAAAVLAAGLMFVALRIVPGATFAVQFRMMAFVLVVPWGIADDGEVEDYQILVSGRDWGDAPDPTYPTLAANNGASHVLDGLFLGTDVDHELDGAPFAIALAVLGVGMGLIASQLGNVVQSSVTDDERGEAGGLQYTAQQLGSAIGTALIGAVVISALLAAFVDNISTQEQISAELSDAIEIEVAAGGNFVSADAIETALLDAGIDESETAAVVDEYREAQLDALKVGLLLVGFLAILSLLFTVNLPGRQPADDDAADEP